jgi:pyruvate dehydrogenase E2 component (dihydrolipoamide acetyltransferase)
MEVGKVVTWLKATGDSVRRGEPIAEIETDKATIELEALADGVLGEIVHQAGDEVAVGQAIAFLSVTAPPDQE